MSYTRHYKFLFVATFLLRTCFGQSSCFPLYGTDLNHPNGILLPLVPAKQYTGARQNSSPTYITQVLNGAQAIWDPTQGPHGVTTQAIVTALKSTLATPLFGGCIPTPVNPPNPPPQSVPFYKTPLSLGSHVMVVGDFNRDGINDIAVVPPGSNRLSMYLGTAAGTFQDPMITTVGTASTRITSVGVTDFNNDRKSDLALVDSANNAVIVLFGRGDGSFFVNADGPPYAPLTLAVGRTPVGLNITDVNNDSFSDIVVTNSADNTVSVIRGNGNGTFVPASVFTVGKNPVSVITQDVNGDGNQDLIVADSGSSDIAELLGFGNGGFQNAVFTKTPAPPTYLASADFNNDGLPDIVALSQDLNAVMMFTGNFVGKLTFTGAFLVPNLAAALSVNDFDGDGNLDLLVPDTDSGSPVLLLGRGDGTLFAPPVYAGANGFTSLATGDFNNDGKVDLVTTGSSATASTLTLLTSLGNGQFQAPVNIPVGGRTDIVAVGDFNKDGRLDIAVSGAQLNILLNQGNGVFQQGAQYAGLTASAVADFNKDGRLDLAGPFNGSLGVMLGNGDGTFRGATSFPVGSNPKTAIVADFNADGSPDLAVLNSGTPGSSSDPGSISVLLGNGTGSFPRVTTVAAGFNPSVLAVGDVNGDGKPDLVVATGVSAAPGAFQISVFVGRGDGTFAAPFAIPGPTGETPLSLSIVDLDGDGNADIVLGDCCSDATTAYFRGNGDGTFQPLVAFYGGNNVRAMVVNDWNGDGKPDLLMAYSPSSIPTLSAVALVANHLSVIQALTNTSGASFLPGPVAPDSIVSGFGPNLTTGAAAASGSLPTTLAGTSVTIQDSKGVSRQAPLFYVSPTQINYLVPAATALGQAKVSVTAPNGVTTAQVNVLSTAPGMFMADGQGLAAATGVRVSGGFQNGFNVFYTDPVTGSVIPVPIFLGAKTDQVFLTLYGTGFRNRSSLDSVRVTIGGVFSPAIYAGPQSEFSGLDQLNVQIPQSLAGSGKVTIQVVVDGVPANPVYVVVQ